MLHAGVMGFDRNPTELFQAIYELSQEEEGFKDDFELILYGQVDQSVRESMANHKIDSMVKLAGNVIRKEAINGIFSAQILMLLLNQQPNAMGRVPGKLFEYLASKRPIFNLGPDNSDVAKLLNKANAGVNFEYQDGTGMKQYLKEQYASFKSGELSQNVDSQIEEYTHQNLTKRIASYLDEISGS